MVSALDADLSVLGPVGASVVRRLGQVGTVAMAFISLGVWIVVPGILGWKFFNNERTAA